LWSGRMEGGERGEWTSASASGRPRGRDGGAPEMRRQRLCRGRGRAAGGVLADVEQGVGEPPGRRWTGRRAGFAGGGRSGGIRIRRRKAAAAAEEAQHRRRTSRSGRWEVRRRAWGGGGGGDGGRRPRDGGGREEAARLREKNERADFWVVCYCVLAQHDWAVGSWIQ